MMCKHPLQTTNHPLRLSSSILPEDFQRNQLCLRCHSFHSAIRTQNSANMCSVSIIIITGSFHCHKIQKSNHILPQIRMQINACVQCHHPDIFPRVTHTIYILCMYKLFDTIHISTPNFSNHRLFLSWYEKRAAWCGP